MNFQSQLLHILKSVNSIVVFASYELVKFITWVWIAELICRYFSCESIAISFASFRACKLWFWIVLWNGQQRVAFLGLRLEPCMCLLFIPCYGAKFETCMHVIIAGCSSTPQEVASHHLPRNGWGEYTAQQRIYFFSYNMPVFIWFTYIHAMANMAFYSVHSNEPYH
jgi:hypothetical protein